MAHVWQEIFHKCISVKKMLYIEQKAIEMSPCMLNRFYANISSINGLVP